MVNPLPQAQGYRSYIKVEETPAVPDTPPGDVPAPPPTDTVDDDDELNDDYTLAPGGGDCNVGERYSL